ncbi:MAG: choice-of-anchor J domain-containing protein [Bacteroidales bacterium]
MKKLILFMGLIALTSFAFSQAKIDEDFNTELPANWTIVDNNSDGSTWFYEDGGYGFDGTNCVSIDTYDPGPADDYLILPQITVDDGDHLAFYAVSASSSYPDDFTVLVSKTGTDVADFTVTVGSETGVSADNYVRFSYDLTANANISDGEQIYIAIYCDSEGSYLNIDNVKVYQQNLINEDFEDGIPADWTVIDEGNNPGTWADTTEGGFDGTNGVWVDTYESGFGQADDWLITPQFEVRSGDVMSFWLYGNDASYEDTIYVEISKTGVNTDDFTVHVDTIYTVTDWTKYQYNIDDISGITAGENVYAALRALSNGSRVFMDNFRVGEYIPPKLIDAYAVSINKIAFVYDAEVNEADITIGDFELSGSQDLTFTDFAISDANSKIVIASVSADMTSDNTLDLLSNTTTGDQVEFYAGLSPIAFVSVTNPDGMIESGYNATFKGIVSAVTSSRVWIQDGVGAHHGINTYDMLNADNVAQGDEIIVVGELDIYDNQSELYPSKLVDIVSSENDVYDAVEITGADIASTIAVENDPAEKYEGSLVKINNAVAIDTVTVEGYIYWSFTDDEGTNTFYVGAPMGLITLDENTFTESEEYNITGIVSNRDGIYSLNPRAGDIEESVGIGDVVLKDMNIYPNPVKSMLIIENIEGVNQISIINTLGQEIKQIEVNGNENLNLDLSELNSGLYFVSFYNEKGILKSSKIIKE